MIGFGFGYRCTTVIDSILVFGNSSDVKRELCGHFENALSDVLCLLSELLYFETSRSKWCQKYYFIAQRNSAILQIFHPLVSELWIWQKEQKCMVKGRRIPRNLLPRRIFPFESKKLIVTEYRTVDIQIRKKTTVFETVLLGNRIFPICKGTLILIRTSLRNVMIFPNRPGIFKTRRGSTVRYWNVEAKILFFRCFV